MRVGLASCQPVQLENAEHGGKVEVKVAALEQGTHYFEASPKCSADCADFW